MGGYPKAEAFLIGESLRKGNKSRKLEDNLRMCISYKAAGNIWAGFNL
jgi:hypothetical protein